MTLNIDKEYLGELGFDYEKIAKALDCQIEIRFVFPDGSVIE